MSETNTRSLNCECDYIDEEGKKTLDCKGCSLILKKGSELKIAYYDNVNKNILVQNKYLKTTDESKPQDDYIVYAPLPDSNNNYFRLSEFASIDIILDLLNKGKLIQLNTNEGFVLNNNGNKTDIEVKIKKGGSRKPKRKTKKRKTKRRTNKKRYRRTRK